MLCNPHAMPSFCLIPGCSKDKKRRPGLSFCRVTKAITNQGEERIFFPLIDELNGYKRRFVLGI